jgi:hypothetical protein
VEELEDLLCPIADGIRVVDFLAESRNHS